MSKKAEFMKFIKEGIGINPSKEMVNFLIETLEIGLTEERVKSQEFLSQMIELTDKYIENSENAD